MPEFMSKEQGRHMEDFRLIGVDVLMGRVEADPAKCNGCGLCTHVCPGHVLQINADKKSVMVEGRPDCLSCGDCVAVCPKGAMEIKNFLQFKRFFGYLDRGEPQVPRKF